MEVMAGRISVSRAGDVDGVGAWGDLLSGRCRGSFSGQRELDG